MAAASRAKSSGKANIHAVLGSDESEVKRAARELAVTLTPPDAGDFGQDIIDGQADNADAAAGRIHQTIDAILTIPFFGGEKMVWLKNANFLSDTVTGRAGSVLEALEKFTELLNAGIPENVRLLISAIDVDKRRSFYKSLVKVAEVQVYDRLDLSKSGWEEEAAMLVRTQARASGLEFEQDAMELFALFTGGDRRVITGEIEKLDLYLGQARRLVSADDVRLLVPMSRAGVIWELGNALAERNVRKALGLLKQLLFQGETAIGILIVAIIPTVRNLLLVKDLMQRHRLARPQQPFFFGKTLERLPADATAHLPRKKDGGINGFALGIAASHAHRFEVGHLRSALENCLQANEQLVTSGLDPQIALNQLIIKIIR